MPRDRGHELAACPTETLRGHRVTRDPSGGIAPLEAVLARYRQPVVAHQSVDVRDRATADQGDRAPGRATQLRDEPLQVRVRARPAGGGLELDERPVDVEEIGPFRLRRQPPTPATALLLGLHAFPPPGRPDSPFGDATQ